MAENYRKIRAIIGTILGIGLPDGNQVNLKNSSGILEVRNEADSAYVVVRGATPAADNDLATKNYVDTKEGITIVARQADTSVSLPANTSTRGFVVVTTAGTGAVLGDLLFDDGTGVGTMSILSAVDGRVISVTVALTGGTITFDADTMYEWDAGSTTWIKIADIGGLAGASRIIRYAITNAATQDSASDIPANARILECRVEVTTPYSGGGTIAVGKAGGSTTLLQTTADNHPQAAKSFNVPQDTDWGAGAAAVRTTIGGTPAAGAGVVIVEHALPSA